MKTPIQKILQELNITDPNIINKYLALEKEIIILAYWNGLKNKSGYTINNEDYEKAIKYFYSTFKEEQDE